MVKIVEAESARYRGSRTLRCVPDLHRRYGRRCSAREADPEGEGHSVLSEVNDDEVCKFRSDVYALREGPRSVRLTLLGPITVPGLAHRVPLQGVCHCQRLHQSWRLLPQQMFHSLGPSNLAVASANGLALLDPLPKRLEVGKRISGGVNQM